MSIPRLERLNHDTPLLDVMEAYVDAITAEGLADKTINWYSQNLVRFHAWLAHNERPCTLADLEPLTVERYLAARRKGEVSYVVNGAEKTLAPAKAGTRRGDAATLKAFATWLADRRGYTNEGGTSVLAALPAGRKKDKDTRDQEPLTDEELARLLGFFRTDSFLDLRNSVTIRLMVDSGCRLGEALTARAQDINWPRNELIVTGKTGTRPVKFSDDTSVVLSRYLKARERRVALGVDVLITNDEGRVWTDGGAETFFKKLKARVGIPRLHAHLLRHTWATNFRRYGCGDLLDLQERGGWSDISMVRRYSHIRPEQERAREQSPLGAMSGGMPSPAYPSARPANPLSSTRVSKLFSQARTRAS